MRYDCDILTVLDSKRLGVGHKVGEIIITFPFVGESIVAFERRFVAEGNPNMDSSKPL
jgi:hypothetical protein